MGAKLRREEGPHLLTSRGHCRWSAADGAGWEARKFPPDVPPPCEVGGWVVQREGESRGGFGSGRTAESG